MMSWCLGYVASVYLGTPGPSVQSFYSWACLHDNLKLNVWQFFMFKFSILQSKTL